MPIWKIRSGILQIMPAPNIQLMQVQNMPCLLKFIFLGIAKAKTLIFCASNAIGHFLNKAKVTRSPKMPLSVIGCCDDPFFRPQYVVAYLED